MKNFINKKIATVTLTVLLSFVSQSAISAKISVEEKLFIKGLAVESIESLLDSSLVDVSESITLNNEVAMNTTLATLLLSVSKK